MSATPRPLAPSDLRRQLVANPHLTLIDVDPPLEYADFHIPRARNEPLETLRPGALLTSGIVPRGEPLCLVCRTEERAKAAAERFAAAGHRDVLVVLGGTRAWIAADLPVTRSAERVVAPQPRFRLVAGLLIVIGLTLGWLVHPILYGFSAVGVAALILARRVRAPHRSTRSHAGHPG